jgi:DNA-binding winged helix-turn-helix (wHTH) protein
MRCVKFTMATKKYKFGRFEFDTGTLELTCEGRTTRLQAQPAQVLALLVENAERVVLREEIKEAIWGKETFVDFERGLNFCISQIRSALQDSATEPIYVRTIPKNGYRFVAPVIRPVHPEPIQSREPAPRKLSSLVTPRRAVWAFAVVAALLFLALLGALIVAVLKPLSGHVGA